MELETTQESNLSRIMSAVIEVEGVVAAILFGSRAKGNYDEYSDYDLLVVFEDDEIMWKNRRKLYENVGKLGLFTQVLTRSIEELWNKTEPTFLQSILEHGIILYLRYPLRVPAFFHNLKPMAIVTYDLKGMAQNEKVKIIYRLFGKQTIKGMVQQNGGRKLGDGCFIIPAEKIEEILQILRQNKVRFEVTEIYEPQNIIEDQHSKNSAN